MSEKGEPGIDQRTRLASLTPHTLPKTVVCTGKSSENALPFCRYLYRLASHSLGVAQSSLLTADHNLESDQKRRREFKTDERIGRSELKMQPLIAGLLSPPTVYITFPHD